MSKDEWLNHRGKNEALYTYLVNNNPRLVEDDFFKPTLQGVVSLPQKAPEGAILRTESALELLERTKKFNGGFNPPFQIIYGGLQSR